MHCRAGCRSQTRLPAESNARWKLGFKQSRFHPIAQVLRRYTPQRQGCPPLYEHAIVLVAFRFQVNSLTFGTSLEVPPG